jgi:hypothetical protein
MFLLRLCENRMLTETEEAAGDSSSTRECASSSHHKACFEMILDERARIRALGDEN